VKKATEKRCLEFTKKLNCATPFRGKKKGIDRGGKEWDLAAVNFAIGGIGGTSRSSARPGVSKKLNGNTEDHTIFKKWGRKKKIGEKRYVPCA